MHGFQIWKNILRNGNIPLVDNTELIKNIKKQQSKKKTYILVNFDLYLVTDAPLSDS